MKKIISLLVGFIFLGSSLFSLKNDKVEIPKNINEEKEIISVDIAKATEAIEPLKEDKPIHEIKEIEKFEPKKSKKEIKQEEFKSKLNEIIDIEDNKEWFIAYKDLTFKYKEWVDMPETVFDAFTEEEVSLICRMVETECYQQDFDSKVNVACVAFNRLDSGKFGDSIKEIITSPHQFAYGRTNISEDTILAVQYAFECEDTTQGALFFHSNDKTETFCGRTYIDTDNAGHHFY